MVELAEPHFYGVGSFAAPVEPDRVMSSALQIAAQMQAQTLGPDDVRGGKLISIFPASEKPAFVSISARPRPGSVAWVSLGLDLGNIAACVSIINLFAAIINLIASL